MKKITKENVIEELEKIFDSIPEKVQKFEPVLYAYTMEEYKYLKTLFNCEIIIVNEDSGDSSI